MPKEWKRDAKCQGVAKLPSIHSNIVAIDVFDCFENIRSVINCMKHYCGKGNNLLNLGWLPISLQAIRLCNNAASIDMNGCILKLGVVQHFINSCKCVA